MSATDKDDYGIGHLPKEFLVNWQGNDFVKYPGLLWAGHRDGLTRITTTLLQVPHADNGNVAIVAAEVETKKGTFSGIGDASPNNVGRMIVPHIIRMAETRAKARALRDATNIGVTAIEELGEGDDAPASSGPATITPNTSDTSVLSEGGVPEWDVQAWHGATEEQYRTIVALCKSLNVAKSDIPEREVVLAKWHYDKAQAWIDRGRAKERELGKGQRR